MERLRSIEIQVEVDTNKATYRETFSLDDYDSLAEQLAALVAWLDDHTDGGVAEDHDAG